MSFKTDIEEAIDTLHDELTDADLGAPTFTWKNVEVECVPNQLNKGVEIGAGGAEMTIGFTLVVKRNNFLSADDTIQTVDSELITSDNGRPHPVRGMSLIFRGRSYKILMATEDSSRAYYKLDLANKHSGR